MQLLRYYDNKIAFVFTYNAPNMVVSLSSASYPAVKISCAEVVIMLSSNNSQTCMQYKLDMITSDLFPLIVL